MCLLGEGVSYFASCWKVQNSSNTPGGYDADMLGGGGNIGIGGGGPLRHPLPEVE